MPSWLTSILESFLPALVLAFLTSLFTVKLAIRKFHEECWWDKKQETYSRLLEALHHLKNYSAEHYEGQMDPNHISDEKRKQLTLDWEKFSREFNKLHDLASFQLSSEAVSILDEYKKRKNEARKSEDVFDWIEGDLDAATDCLDRLKAAAKKDLKVK